MSVLMLWLTMVGTGAVALRLSFIALLGQMEMPGLLERALRFVPALMALVIPWRGHGYTPDAAGQSL